LSIGIICGKSEHWSHEFGGFFSTKQQLDDRRWPDPFLAPSVFFHTHPLLPEFVNFNRGIVLTIKSFNFRIGTKGVIRLSDLICSDLSATNFTIAAT
jgi:hypothetical protein